MFNKKKHKKELEKSEPFDLTEAQIKFLDANSYTPEQKDAYIKGFEWGVTVEQMEVIGNPVFTPKQILFLLRGFDFCLPEEQMRLIANPDFDTYQINVLECGYRDVNLGYVDIEVVRRVTNPSIPHKEMCTAIDENKANHFFGKI